MLAGVQLRSKSERGNTASIADGGHKEKRDSKSPSPDANTGPSAGTGDRCQKHSDQHASGDGAAAMAAPQAPAPRR